MLEKIYKVYFLKNKAREIIYCGLTRCSLVKRLVNHKWRKKLDKDVVIELVQDNLSLEEAVILERKLIEQYDLIHKGLNISPGSINGYSNTHSEEYKRKMSLERKGKPVTPEHAEKNRKARLGLKNSDYHKQMVSEKVSKAVICLETGVVYKNARVAAKELNLQYSKISLVCNGKRGTTGGLHFEFYKKR